jgi:hypothetical protein
MGLVLALVETGNAQVIRSYESMDRSAGQGRYATLALSADVNTGNVDFVDLDLSGALGFRGQKHWIRFYPAYRIRRSEGDTKVHERSAHLRHSYVFTARTRTFAFVQIQADRSLELDRRFLVGGGVRRQIIELGEGGVDLGVGLMFEEERLSNGDERSDLRGANLLSVYGSAGTVALSGSGFFQPVMSDWGDHRVAVELSATAPLSIRLSVEISARWRRDSRPPQQVEPDDGGVRVGFRFSVD